MIYVLAARRPSSPGPAIRQWPCRCAPGSGSAPASQLLRVDRIVVAATGENCVLAAEGDDIGCGRQGAIAWGLRDTHGNVWEWCWDWYGTYPTGPVVDPTGPASGPGRVLRGGSCYLSAYQCRSAYHDGAYPGDMGDDLGLRLSRTAP
jgi:formylglycine-generating enzyme required for sulfatase activity